MGFWGKLLGRKEGERKFHRDLDLLGLSYIGSGDSTFIKVDESEQVVGTGNPIWGKDGQVHWIVLPWLWKERPSHTVHVELSQKAGTSSTVVGVNLTVFFKTAEWDYQDLYNKVVRAGFDHIDNWLAHLYRSAAESDPAVQKAFTRYARHERPALFIEELSGALQALEFSGHPLNNIERIEANAQLDTVRATLQATYNAG